MHCSQHLVQCNNIIYRFSSYLHEDSVTVFTLAWRSDHVAGCTTRLSATIPIELPGRPAVLKTTLCSKVISQKRNRGLGDCGQDLPQHLDHDANTSSQSNDENSDDDTSMHDDSIRRPACSNKRAKRGSDGSGAPPRERGQDAMEKGPRGWMRVEFDNLWHQFPSGWPFPVWDTHHRNQLGLPSEHKRSSVLLRKN